MEKRLLWTVVMMVVCVNGMFAQTENENEIGVSNTTSGDAQKTTDDTSLREVVSYLMAISKQNASTQENHLTVLPVTGRSKFSRRHHITQRLEISVTGGTDRGSGYGESVKSEYDDADDEKSEPGTNYGLNFGYSLVFAPGRVEGDKLYLNKLGIAYSTGLIASFDKQDKYGTTCDFLLKLGIEAGHGHPMGIGFDLLVGTGKTAGEYNFTLEDDEADPNNYEPEEMNLPYTMWCFKYGAQLWLRSNLLQAKVKNTDVRLFARYVYSKNPENEDELLKDGIFCDWHEESWTFGLTFCYTF